MVSLSFSHSTYIIVCVRGERESEGMEEILQCVCVCEGVWEIVCWSNCSYVCVREIEEGFWPVGEQNLFLFYYHHIKQILQTLHVFIINLNT